MYNCLDPKRSIDKCLLILLNRQIFINYYYNKEYREGLPRECLLTAAVSEAPNLKGEVLHSRPL